MAAEEVDLPPRIRFGRLALRCWMSATEATPWRGFFNSTRVYLQTLALWPLRARRALRLLRGRPSEKAAKNDVGRVTMAFPASSSSSSHPQMEAREEGPPQPATTAAAAFDYHLPVWRARRERARTRQAPQKVCLSFPLSPLVAGGGGVGVAGAARASPGDNFIP